MSTAHANPIVDGTLSWAHPVVRDWFIDRFGSPTEPQALGWPHILRGRSTLISAPTGAGKTLAAFLACIDRLVRAGIEGTLTDRTEIVYVSPLKALGNDVQKNLDGPLAEIVALARARGHHLADIRTAVRTGDTLMPDRRAMLRRPPHILVTTPESLYILLTASQSRERLRDVHTVIVDEIHAVADDKRGAHLLLSLERLEHLGGRDVTRIGLSATQEPIETVAGFLAGCRPLPAVVEVRRTTPPDVTVEVPSSELGPVASNELWSEVYDRIADLAREHRSTLVFVNTRRLAERVSHHLIERLGAESVAAHHGSLARRLRLEAEHRLKTGALRVLVATASLELGIDIGSVDLVCQVGSPRSIAVALQRVGRAGHWRGALPKGRFFATTLDELGECAALVRTIRQGRLDRLIVPPAPLDVLAQQIVAMAAAEEWREDALFAVVRRAHSYREITRAEFDEILEMLATGIAGRRGRMAAYLHRDRVNGILRARRGAKLTAITSGGAIPETGLYTVVAEPEGTVVGTVDEDFAVESMAGDIMLLGNTSWRIRRVSIAGRVLVEDARGAPPTIPFWRGEAPARTRELSIAVSDLRRDVDALAPDAHPGDASAGAPSSAQAVAWLREECGLDQAGAEQFVDYVVTGRAVLGVVPSTHTVVAERFFDEGGGMQLVIHAPFGARLNRAWGLALRKRFCRSFNYELQASATDNAINIALAEQHSFPLADVFAFLKPATVREVLQQAALDSPLFGTRWRWDAGRSLALPRFRGGKKLPIHLLRLLSDDLLAAVFPDVAACQENIEGDIAIPDHPLVREVMKDVLHEAMDLDGLIAVLRDIESGEVRTVAVDTPVPSVFSHEVLNANPYAFLDDAPLEERRARAVELRRVLPEAVLTEIGRLDQRAIEEVASQAWPDVRGPEDLHDALLTLVLFPAAVDVGSGLSGRIASAVRDWAPWTDELRRARRVVRATVRGRSYWIASERVETFNALAPDAVADDPPPVFDQPTPSFSEACLAVSQGWLTHTGPVTSAELAGLLGLDEHDVEDAILRLEAAGWALRGVFRGVPTSTLEMPTHEWCERRLLARIHRLTVGALRREIAPVTAATFMGWLFDWQHVSPGARAQGPNATLEVLRQLQGFEAPANAWEPQILARRIAGYDTDELDRLCLTGIVGWGRLSPHPATLRETPGPRRVVPTSVAPVTFFLREDADWMRPRTDEPAVLRALSGNAKDVLEQLRRAGASFFPDIVRITGHLKSEVEAALWELVAAGLVTADGFDNLRSLIDPRRRAGHGSGRTIRPRHSAGRWALLHDQAPGDRVRTAEASSWMLLRRYGVVFRELLARESLGVTWRELLIALRRLEDRGQVRGGRFVSGFIGEQFALPVAVESLRAARDRKPSAEIITVSASDPLNLVGIIVPGDKVAAHSAKTVSFRAGIPTDERLTPAI
jgi:ATP-dependent Lhr-like helicase